MPSAHFIAHVTNRILDFSDGGAFLRVENQQLVVERKEQAVRTIPLEDIAVLVAGTTWLTLTQSVLSELAARGAVVVVSDSRNLPVAMSLPLFGHSLQAQKLATQCSARPPRIKQLWKQLVVAKIRSQAAALRALHSDDGGVEMLTQRVRSGDPGNVEAQAARRYWPLLFRDPSFRRTPGEGTPPNHLLDYGYAVLRAIIARAICGTGLHPTLGLHHHERDNSFALADDLMEPYRPLVDHAVATLCREGLGQAPLNRTTKGRLLNPLLNRYVLAGEERTLFDLAGMLSASVLRSLQGEAESLPLPELFRA